MTPKYLDITAQNPHHQEISHLIVLAHICINEIDSRLHANSCIMHGLLRPNTKLFFEKKKENPQLQKLNHCAQLSGGKIITK